MAFVARDPTPSDANFAPPPHLTNDAGKTRTVGFELEFGSIDASAAAEIVTSLYGGSISKENEFCIAVNGTRLGDFGIKLDTRLVQTESGDGPLQKLEAELVQLAGFAASAIIPYEIVTPPVPIDALAELAPLVPALREKGASGTETSLLYAFALHINPECPSLKPQAIAASLKSFVLLNPWLWQRIAPDPTRRLLGFAEPFDNAYAAKLADPHYWPEEAELISDYLAANPTRNRDLDLLPLLAYLDEDLLRAKLPGEKINPRPTFHFRLPDARVSDPGWSIAEEWNRWVAVERLAADEERLREACADLHLHGSDRERWTELANRLAAA